MNKKVFKKFDGVRFQNNGEVIFAVGLFLFLGSAQVQAQDAIMAKPLLAEDEERVLDPNTNSALEFMPAGPSKKVEVTLVETEIQESQLQRNGNEISEEALEPAFLPVNPPPAKSVVPRVVEDELSKVEIQGRQVIQVNQSLRRIIDQNEKLRQEKEELDKSLRTIRGQRTLEENRLNTAVKERDQYKLEMKRISEMNMKFQADVANLQDLLNKKEQWLNNKLRDSGVELSITDEKQLKDLALDLPQTEQSLGALRYDVHLAKERLEKLKAELALTENRALSPKLETGSLANKALTASAPKAATGLKSAMASEKKAEQVMDVLNDLSGKSEAMRFDEAKVHYNMGNKFFHNGDYRQAAEEYQKTLDLQPQDANAHFNLAYVSGEFIKDYKRAEEHYRKYLMLNPAASDANLVKEKVIEAELILRSTISDAVSEREWQKKRSEIYTR